MNKAIKRAPWLLLVFIFVLALFPLTAFAGSSGVSVSSGSVKVGQTFTATVSFNGGGANVAGATASVSYDASVIQYVSASGDGSANIGGGGGKVVLETASTSRGSLSIKLTFKALKEGSSSVSVSGVDMVDWDGNQLSAGGSSASVSVAAAAATSTSTPTNKPTQSASASPSPSVDKNLENAQNGLKQLVDGQELMVWRDLSTVTPPEGFAASAYEIEGEAVQAFKKEGSPLILLYLTDATGQNGAFYVYNESVKTITKYMVISAATKAYVPVEPAADVKAPEGYVQTTKMIGETQVFAWEKEDGDQNFFLFYAMNSEGVSNFYVYDVLEGTIQRFDESTLAVVPEPDPEPTETAIAEPVDEKGLFARLMDDDGILAVVGAMAGVVVILLVIILAMVISNRKKKKLSTMSHVADTYDATDYEAKEEPLQEEAKEPEEKNDSSGDNSNF